LIILTRPPPPQHYTLSLHDALPIFAAHPWVELRTPAEALAHHRPRGLAYLPTATYHEMEEWALPPRARVRYQRAAEILAPAFGEDRKSTRLNSRHVSISYAVCCLKK